jgi:RecA-family ATPase
VPDNICRKIDEWLDGKFFLYNNEYGNVASQTLNDIKILTQAGVKVFVVDNMMSMNIDVFDGDKNDKQKQFILALKDFAMKEQVHVILVAHPRKSVAFLRKTDISGSGDIINAVDNCFIFHRVNEDFIHAITEFYDAKRAIQMRQYGNVLAVEKNRLMGVVDLMVGMHYEIESRRFKNTPDERIRYGWEEEPHQQTINYYEPRKEEDIIDAPYDPNEKAPF